MMGISALFVCLVWALGLFELNSALGLNGSGIKCKLQSAAHPPAFSMDGDYVVGGVFGIHYSMHTVRYNYTTVPEPLRCTGRFV